MTGPFLYIRARVDVPVKRFGYHTVGPDRERGYVITEREKDHDAVVISSAAVDQVGNPRAVALHTGSDVIDDGGCRAGHGPGDPAVSVASSSGPHEANR